MSRSVQRFDDAGAMKRWGASALLSVVLHALVGVALVGVVYEVAARAEERPLLRDISMTMRSGSVQSFVNGPRDAQSDLAALLKGAPAEKADAATPTLAEVMQDMQSKSSGVSALGEVATSSTSALAGGGALGGVTPSASGGSAASASSVVFAGLSASGQWAKSVVYVVDASGPMVSSLADVFAELMRSVDALQPTQRFGVVLFRQTGDGRVLAFDSKLRDATAANRTALRAWLTGVNAAGRSNPLDGLRAGLEMRPQAIFLLSRSIPRAAGNPWEAEAGGPEAILRELETLNPSGPGGLRPTVIKTLQFLEPDPSGVMERIGRAHGGSGEGATPPFRVVRRNELSRR